MTPKNKKANMSHTVIASIDVVVIYFHVVVM